MTMLILGGSSPRSSARKGSKNPLRALFGSSTTSSSRSLVDTGCPPSPSRGCLKVKTVEESCNSIYGDTNDDDHQKGDLEDVACHTSCDTGSKAAENSVEEASPQGTSRRPSRRNLSRSVSFSGVDIFSHKVTLGDNPAVNDGPPLTLDWKVLRRESFDLEQYEAAKGPNSYSGPEDMRIPGWLRNYMLRGQGIPNRKLVKTLREVERIHRSREAEIEKAMSEESASILRQIRSCEQRAPGDNIDNDDDSDASTIENE